MATIQRPGYMDEERVDDAFQEIEKAHLEAEEKIALWSLLNSKHRSALKAHGRDLQRKSVTAFK